MKKKKTLLVIKRFRYLKNLEQEGKIQIDFIYFDNKDNKTVKYKKGKFNRKNKVIVDGKEYTDKTSWFILDNDTLWIVGKKEDFLVELHSEILENVGGN